MAFESWTHVPGHVPSLQSQACSGDGAVESGVEVRREPHAKGSLAIVKELARRL